MILFIKTSQAYHDGYKFGINAKLIDEQRQVLGQIKGGGFDIEGYLFQRWVKKTYGDLLTQAGKNIDDGMGLGHMNTCLSAIGVHIREVKSPVSNLFVYEVMQ